MLQIARAVCCIMHRLSNTKFVQTRLNRWIVIQPTRLTTAGPRAVCFADVSYFILISNGSCQASYKYRNIYRTDLHQTFTVGKLELWM